MKQEVKEFWRGFCQKHGLAENTEVGAFAFGSPKEDADELADLVNQGIKTATTSAYELYERNENLPYIGEWNIILDGAGKPVCVTQEKVVEITSYNQISAEHAYHEGEGDRSYQYWRQVHDDFFKLEYQEEGKKFYPQAPMVCEVFEKVE